MPDKEDIKRPHEIFWETHEKLDMYLIGVTFTVLGAAVQTAKFDGDISRTAQWLELIAWAVLLLSGFAGIAKLWFLAAMRTFDPYYEPLAALRDSQSKWTKKLTKKRVKWTRGLDDLRRNVTEQREEIAEHRDDPSAPPLGQKVEALLEDIDELREQDEKLAARSAASLAKIDAAEARIKKEQQQFSPAVVAGENMHYPAFFIGACFLVAARAHDPLWKLIGWL